MGPAPVALVREVAAAGEVMPPKSTYFFPKVLTGLLFNPLGERCLAWASPMRASAPAARELPPRRPRAVAHDHGGRAAGPRRRRQRAEPAGAAGRVAGLLHGDHDGDVRQAQALGRRRAAGRRRVHARPSAGARRSFDVLMKVPAHLSEEQVEQARGDRRKVPRPPDARGRGRLRRAGRAGLTPAPGSRPRCAAPCSTRRGRPAHRARRQARGGAGAAVPRRAGALHAVFTERRADLRRHAGEISFPGGRRDETTPTFRRPRCARRTRRSGCRRTRSSCWARCSPRRRSSPTTRSIRSSA